MEYSTPKVTIDLKEYNSLIQGNTEKISATCLLRFIRELVAKNYSQSELHLAMSNAGYTIEYTNMGGTVSLGRGKTIINLNNII